MLTAAGGIKNRRAFVGQYNKNTWNLAVVLLKFRVMNDRHDLYV